MKKLPIFITATVALLIVGSLYYKKFQENDPMAGVPDTAALEEEFENKETQKENSNENNNQSERDLSQDPVYRYANNLIAQLHPYPPCVVLGQTIRDIASSQAPADVREHQIDIIFNKMPDICTR
jgi:hypothetical protein